MTGIVGPATVSAVARDQWEPDKVTAEDLPRTKSIVVRGTPGSPQSRTFGVIKVTMEVDPAGLSERCFIFTDSEGGRHKLPASGILYLVIPPAAI